ncbi:MAG: cytochrome c [Deltaproteobacteria bacterium]|nr:cytochrome c [Deltaproteobacteria bacterium]
MRLIKYVFLLAVVFAALKVPGVLFAKPLPVSMLQMFFFFSAVVILLAMTATDEGAAGLVQPVISLFIDPSYTISRAVVIIIIPLIAAWITFAAVCDEAAAPPIVRSLHPSPPSAFTAYGRTIEMAGLANPYRAIEKTDEAAFRGLVLEGGKLYFKNCFFCHGAKLDGAGHFSQGLTPLPLPFKGTDTIAQLQESYVFWRIVKGGPGLPHEATPWLSAMPAWEKMMTEDEVWKTTLFIYDYTDNRSRSWAR